MPSTASWWRILWADLLDRGAYPPADSKLWPLVWSSGLVAVTTALSGVTALDRLLMAAIGFPSSMLPVLAVASGLCASWWMIGARQSPSGRVCYRFPQGIRNLAKAAFVLFIVLLPIRGADAVKTLLPLEQTLHGFLIDPAGEAIKGAVVRVENADGVDITDRSLASDDMGLFIVKVTSRPYPTGRFIVTWPGCDHSSRLPMRRTFRRRWPDNHPARPTDPTPKAFFYTLECD